ncbi:hypothetical protein DERF_014017 [Dermatophagoides farinae]|uniref:Uncharacterized protein n=1 Tax=Dermatophagoides farinae TaxID=6954 RepID=A0A922HNU6_DERFA|nr:hypothetical protein DERF_014017 [Dermatophagoides farinae]
MYEASVSLARIHGNYTLVMILLILISGLCRQHDRLTTQYVADQLSPALRMRHSIGGCLPFIMEHTNIVTNIIDSALLFESTGRPIVILEAVKFAKEKISSAAVSPSSITTLGQSNIS